MRSTIVTTQEFYRSIAISIIFSLKFFFLFFLFFPQDTDSSQDNLFHTSKTFKCDGEWKQDYIRYHANSLKSQSKDRKFLIYYCAGHSGGCGGYGNRMIGLVSVFYLAVLLNRTFMIHWGGPELLETYLQPNKIDWTYNEFKFKEMKSRKGYWGLERIAGYDHFHAAREGKFLSWSQGVNFNSYLNFPVENLATIWYFADKLWDNPHLKTRAKEIGLPMKKNSYPYSMIGCAMNFLFKKSKTLMREFNKVKSELDTKRDGPLIGIHLRTSDYQFGSNNPLSVRTKDTKRVFVCAERVEKALQHKFFNLRKKKFTWVLAVDNIDLKKQALKDYPDKLVTLNIVPKHLDVSKSGHQEIFRDLLMDQLMLVECDFFILTSSSTFSTVILGLRQFSVNSFVSGEKCELDKEKVTLAPEQRKNAN